MIFIMNYKFLGGTFFVFLLCMGFVSAGLTEEMFSAVTGNSIIDIQEAPSLEMALESIVCEDIRDVFNENFTGYMIPEKIPFKDELFNIYIDDEFFISFKLSDKQVILAECEAFEKATYNVYVTSNLIKDAVINRLDINPVDYYNQNMKSGDLKIKPVGFARKVKMGFINLGLKIASWFI